jgi:hypothetical protein
MISSNFNRLKRNLEARIYHEETDYLLNYVTLNIRNAKLADEIWVHQGKQFERIIIPLTCCMLLGCSLTYINLYVS